MSELPVLKNEIEHIQRQAEEQRKSMKQIVKLTQQLAIEVARISESMQAIREDIVEVKKFNSDKWKFYAAIAGSALTGIVSIIIAII